jgi:hypothetical protein
VRIDADFMEWLKRPEKGFQTRLNAILSETTLRDQNKSRPIFPAVVGEDTFRALNIYACCLCGMSV